MNGKMKSFTSKALAIAAGMVVLVLVQSNPTQASTLQVGVTVYDTADPTNFYSRVIVDNGAGDLDPNPHAILLGNNFEPIPGFVVQGSYHTAHLEPNILTSASSSVTNTRGTTSRAFVVVSDTDFKPPTNATFVTGSGTWTNAAGSTIALGYYNDPNNGQYAAPFVPFDTLGNPNPAPVLFADFDSFDQGWASLLSGDLVASFSDTATSDHDSFGFNGGPYGVSNVDPFSMALMFDFSVVPNGMLTSRGLSMEADPIPEPSTFLLLGAGLGGVVWLRRRK
ncbi:protein of unknown function DUF1555 [Geobacter metallireducens RCH3]|uniref:PEP motif-containing protein, putative exosortase substrate n=1 Tax=Geobacter metallireducens (strain ATCC 53774 / DSM 7210 / GS-15) TaxID=269799 RepID=Q39S31_GEOMG|nr:PEP-CTERM sorting domain-containing protein [Geobacter metallireducens]ABB32943.1 PEP motif-containing protein, putative exosortase substrate [Geobacter metallireducens GS-15]EHP88922.1 protein of unknown function DUF1555 [Geobacter metallireducens RCH3]